jgi:hypothetical protein
MDHGMAQALRKKIKALRKSYTNIKDENPAVKNDFNRKMKLPQPTGSMVSDFQHTSRSAW